MSLLSTVRRWLQPPDSADDPGASRPGWKRTLDLTSFFLFVLGFLALGLVAGVAQGVLLIASLLLIPGAILSRQPNPPLYTRAWNLATILFVLLSLAAARWSEATAVQTLAHLCVFLQVYHAFNYRRPRDYFQLWTLTLMMFLLVPLSQSTPPVGFGALLLGLLAVSVWHFGALGWMADWRQLPRREAGARRAQTISRAEPVLLPGSESESRLAGAPFFRVWNRLAAAGLVLTLLAFFALPRPFLPPSIRDAESAESVRARQNLLTGLTQTIDLRQLSSLHGDPTIAIRLSGGPFLRLGLIRLRAATLDWFDGNRWERSASFVAGISLPRHPDAPEFRLEEPVPTSSSDGALRSVRITVSDLGLRTLLTLPGTVGVGDISGEVWLNDDATLMTWPDTPDRYVLFVEPEGETPAAVQPSVPGGAPFERYLQIYDRLNREWLGAKAKAMVAGASTDLERARRIETWLKREGVYSLDLRGLNLGDGTTVLHRFLDSPHPEGHCELFASSMALLTRSLRLPSRVVTGFLGGEVEENQGDLVFRYQDAHAWVEVWIPGRGWMTFDPTPPAPLVSFSDRLPFRQIREWLSDVLGVWQRIARDYGVASQRRAMAWIGDQFDRLMSPLFPRGGGGAWEKLVEGFRLPTVRWMAVGLLALNLVAIALWRRSRRSGRSVFGPPSGLAPREESAFWEPIRRALLLAAGAEPPLPPPGYTLGEYLLAEASRNGIEGGPIRSALALYESRRFGTHSWSTEDQRYFDQHLGEIVPDGSAR